MFTTLSTSCLSKSSYYKFQRKLENAYNLKKDGFTLFSAQAIIVRAEPLLRVEDVRIDLMKGIGSVGECINVKLKLFSALEEVSTYLPALNI